MARFTVVLPVRNGGAYLREAVASVQAQSHDDFTLEILENGSTDGTGEWLRTLRDPRIRVWPAPAPLSMEQNWQRVVALPKAEFLLFLGHDDRLDPGYLAIVDGLIRRAPDAALFTTHFRLIDGRGRVLRPCRPMAARETRAEFLAARLTSRIDMTGMGVVMRSAAHDALGGIPPFERLTHADDALWLALLDGAWKATAPDEAFSYRLHAGGTGLSLPWRGAMRATEQFARFVETLAATDADVAAVWRADGPTFLARRYRFILLFAMTAPPAAAERLGARERDEVLASLHQICPAAARRLGRRWWVRRAPWLPAGPLQAPIAASLRGYWWLRRRWR